MTLLMMLLTGCGKSATDAAAEPAHAEHAEANAEPAKGPHDGRLLSDGALTVELALFEQGVAPEYRAWVTQGGQPVPAEAVQLTVDLTRFGGVQQAVRFKPAGEFLQSTEEIFEPRSFDVEVRATHAGKAHAWRYESHEGRTTIAADLARQAGVVTALAGPGEIGERLKLYGAIAADPASVREVTARFPGVVRQMTRQIGDTVRAGETLARVESNDSLQTYAVTSPIGGVITARDGAVGEGTGVDALYTVADFSKVWVELQSFPRDRARLKLQQPLTVRAEDGREAAATLSYVGAQGLAGNPAITVRAVLGNAERRWTPGEFVTAEVALQQIARPLVVPLSALQTVGGKDVVFAVDGESYQALPVELGQRDARQVEVTRGLEAGTRIVVGNSYLLKADIEKSGAAHDH